MSESNLDREEHPGAATPRLEPWLAVMLVAIVPMLVALFVSRELVLHLGTISGILFVAAVGMLVAQERRRRLRSN